MADPRGQITSRWRDGALLLAVALGGALIVLAAALIGDRRSGDQFDLVRWERETFAAKWLYHLGAPFRRDPHADDALARYFAAPVDSPDRRGLQKHVEASLDGRIDAALRARGVLGALPLPGSVFPPVNVELTQPPRVLVVSSRERIERISTDLLRPELSTTDAVEIERAEEAAHPDRSVLVVPSGGVAAYPAIVSSNETYADTVATAAHEWTHHYLEFYPLGLHYFTSLEVVTINETVADIVGAEIASDVLARWGDPTTPVAPPAAPSARVDANAVLRDLRREVDALLAAGQIDDAEARMEAVRQELANRGYRIRRINQAYFAWYGTYAARPDATDPLGVQLREIRERSGSLAAFLEVIRATTSRADVVAALDRLRARG